MKIAIGNDHRGYALKKEVLQEIKDLGHEAKDFGSFGEKDVDFPDYALIVARAVATGECDCGILICGTGIGMSIAANKVKGIRAARCQDCFSARMAREHNDANILCLGGWVMGPGLAREVVRAYLVASFQREERYYRRLQKIAKIESGVWSQVRLVRHGLSAPLCESPDISGQSGADSDRQSTIGESRV